MTIWTHLKALQQVHLFQFQNQSGSKTFSISTIERNPMNRSLSNGQSTKLIRLLNEDFYWPILQLRFSLTRLKLYFCLLTQLSFEICFGRIFRSIRTRDKMRIRNSILIKVLKVLKSIRLLKNGWIQRWVIMNTW